MSLVRVFKVPMPDGEFCFGSGRPKTFIEVDWFRDDADAFKAEPMMLSDAGRAEVEKFIRRKGYFDEREAYLVLSTDASFTINYNAP